MNFTRLVDNIKITELQSDNQIDELSNEELQQVVGGLPDVPGLQVVGGLPDVPGLRQKLSDLGIDTEAIEQFVRDLFGQN